MNIRKVALASLALALTGAVHARGISVDGYSVFSTGSGTSISTDIDGVAINFTPGTSQSTYTFGSYAPGTFVTAWGPSVEYGWAPLPGQPASPLNFADQVQIYPQSATEFQIYFNYGAASCSGETASFSVSGTTYKSSNPCAVSLVNGGILNSLVGGSGNDFIVDNGKVSTVPAGWTGQSAAAAPELESNSTIASLTLLMAIAAAMRGRGGSGRRAGRRGVLAWR